MTRTAAELTEIAKALNIWKYKDSKKTLVSKISTHLRANPNLAKESQFQGLFAYRPDKDAAKAPTKNSADRDAEDKAEASKGAGTVTGALKMLSEHGIARDPPARVARLNIRTTRSSVHQSEPQETISAGAELSSSSAFESPPASPLVEQVDSSTAMNSHDVQEPIIMGGMDSDPDQISERAKEPSPKQTNRTFMVHHDSVSTANHVILVIVAFERDTGSGKSVDEVHIPHTQQLAIHERDEQGNICTYVRLSELLPVAFKYVSTPMKKRGGRLFRPGLSSEGAQVDIGSLESIARQERLKYLESEKVNHYLLESVQGEEESLVCRLFVRDPETSSTSKTSLVLCENFDREAHASAPFKPMPSQGVGRANLGATSLSAKKDDPFVAWLWKLLKGREAEWPKVTVAGDAIARVKAIHEAMAAIRELGWERSSGGYRVPEDYVDAGAFTGRMFTKQEILTALRLGHSSSNGYEQLFARETMLKLPKLRQWFDDPSGPLASTFGYMTVKQLKQWQADKLGSRSSKGKSSKSSKRKRSKASDSDSDSSSDSDSDLQHGRSKKGKKVKRMRSEDLDASLSD
ncbi:hypothetical protein BD310DRAFT_883403 [Dichomitus squalens]|uniref:Uncharacterized protein n=1 Tax=Dichomitus squalens TaxID=114155 RepID=A0A4Q9PNW7_9APHY|nr:hypothetical protein BD310DRAFT_883403 [Dichomitus squalens]